MARIGDYEIIDRYATGGVAEIYRARHVSSGEIVVIKRMRGDVDFDPEHQAGFLRELQVALLARHKNLIRGLMKGSFNGLDYGVLEYVDGPDLAVLLARARELRGVLPASVALYIIRELLDGLEFAYHLKGPDGRELGLVHRDLSPKNIFITSAGAVRIGDFGSALASLVERVDEVVGSPGYMSPEQASRAPLDQRSDLFAVGVILQEMLTGAPALDVAGKNDAQILKLHQRAERRKLPDAIDEQLGLFIDVATARDVEERFPSARAMRAALDRIHTSPPDVAADLATLVHRLCPAELKRGAPPPLPGAP